MGLKALCKAARLQQQDYTFLISAISIWAAHGYIDRPLHRLQMQEHIHAELQQNFTQSEYDVSGALAQDYNQLLDRGQLLQLV